MASRNQEGSRGSPSVKRITVIGGECQSRGSTEGIAGASVHQPHRELPGAYQRRQQFNCQVGKSGHLWVR